MARYPINLAPIGGLPQPSLQHQPTLPMTPLYSGIMQAGGGDSMWGDVPDLPGGIMDAIQRSAGAGIANAGQGVSNFADDMLDPIMRATKRIGTDIGDNIQKGVDVVGKAFESVNEFDPHRTARILMDLSPEERAAILADMEAKDPDKAQAVADQMETMAFNRGRADSPLEDRSGIASLERPREGGIAERITPRNEPDPAQSAFVTSDAGNEPYTPGEEPPPVDPNYPSFLRRMMDRAGDSRDKMLSWLSDEDEAPGAPTEGMVPRELQQYDGTGPYGEPDPWSVSIADAMEGGITSLNDEQPRREMPEPEMSGMGGGSPRQLPANGGVPDEQSVLDAFGAESMQDVDRQVLETAAQVTGASPEQAQAVAKRGLLYGDTSMLPWVAMGLQMAASNNPSVLGAIGEGGITALNMYARQKQADAANANAERRIQAMERNQASQEAIRQERLAMEREKMQQLQDYRRQQLGLAGARIAQGRQALQQPSWAQSDMIDPNTGTPLLVDRKSGRTMPVQGAKRESGIGGLTPYQIESLADRRAARVASNPFGGVDEGRYRELLERERAMLGRGIMADVLDEDEDDPLGLLR